MKKNSEKGKGKSRNNVQKVNVFVLTIAYWGMRIYSFLCGVRVKAVNKVGNIEKPAIILCNHGSFVDFIFVAKLLRKYKPNFVIARLYFYNKYLRWVLKTIGGFPKSMFAMDMESTKNCLKVMKSNGILAMMPEARLSTSGRFEDIQSNTYTFIKKAAVTVYTVKFNGDYFASPKWGKGFRRGAVVEAELDVLYTADQVKALSIEEIKQGIEERLYYNEFEWIKGRPDVVYKSKNIAEGLENILTTCPICKQKHCLITKNNTISCEHCGYLTSMDQQYGFTNEFQFKNLAEWYDWQKDILTRDILENPDYVLRSNVEFRLPGEGKGLTRFAGEGVCSLNREGLFYEGTRDGEQVKLHFPLQKIYRLLFGAGENFETYDGEEIQYFVPEERRSAVEWYMASMILHDNTK